MSKSQPLLDRVDKIIQSIRRFSKYYEVAVFKLVVNNRGDAPQVNSGVITFIKKGGKESDMVLDYGKLILYKKVMPIEEIISVIRDLIISDKICIGDVTYNVQGSLNEPRFNSSKGIMGHLRSEWPSQYVEFTINNAFDVSSKLLIVKDLPFYPDGRKAVSDFLYSGSEDIPYAITIQIPDYRARIQKLTISQNKVAIEVDTGFLDLSNIACKIYAEYNPRSSIYSEREIRAMHSPELTIEHNFTHEFEQEFTSINTVIYDKNDYDIIDVKEYYYTWPSSEGVSVERPEPDFHEIIRRGENLTTEFKADLTDEFLETVVAFANTSGGYILLGVADDGRIKGFNAKSNDQIENLIKGNIDPIPNFNIKENELDGKPITIVEVFEGDDKPYSHRQLGIYVRSSGSDLHGTRTDWERIYRNKKESGIHFR